MGYILPQDVSAPREHWELLDVLYDAGPGQPSIALGKWDDDDVVAARWNGDDTAGSALGNPQSRGLATWLILPDWMAAPALHALRTQHTAGDGNVRHAALERAVAVFEQKH